MKQLVPAKKQKRLQDKIVDEIAEAMEDVTTVTTDVIMEVTKETRRVTDVTTDFTDLTTEFTEAEAVTDLSEEELMRIHGAAKPGVKYYIKYERFNVPLGDVKRDETYTDLDEEMPETAEVAIPTETVEERTDMRTEETQREEMYRRMEDDTNLEESIYAALCDVELPVDMETRLSVSDDVATDVIITRREELVEVISRTDEMPTHIEPSTQEVSDVPDDVHPNEIIREDRYQRMESEKNLESAIYDVLHEIDTPDVEEAAATVIDTEIVRVPDEQIEEDRKELEEDVFEDVTEMREAKREKTEEKPEDVGKEEETPVTPEPFTTRYRISSGEVEIIELEPEPETRPPDDGIIPGEPFQRQISVSTDDEGRLHSLSSIDDLESTAGKIGVSTAGVVTTTEVPLGVVTADNQSEVITIETQPMVVSSEVDAEEEVFDSEPGVTLTETKQTITTVKTSRHVTIKTEIMEDGTERKEQEPTSMPEIEVTAGEKLECTEEQDTVMEETVEPAEVLTVKPEAEPATLESEPATTETEPTRPEAEPATAGKATEEPTEIILVDDVEVIEGEPSKPVEPAEPFGDTTVEEITLEEVDSTRRDEPSEVETSVEKAELTITDSERKEEPTEVKTAELESEPVKLEEEIETPEEVFY